MYVNIGSNTLLLKKYIIGIFDIETTTGSEITRGFLGSMSKRKEVISITEELPRAMVLYNERGKTSLYVTELSAAAVKRRAAE